MRLLIFLLLFLEVFCAKTQPNSQDPFAPYVMYDDRGNVWQQQIVETKGDVSTRRIEIFWPNGKMKIRNETKNMATGFTQQIQEWTQDGTKIKDAFSDYTLPDGAKQMFREWYANGDMSRKWDWFRSGDSVTYSLWYQNGTLARTFSMSKGQLHGLYTLYDSLGTMRLRGNYHHSIRDGVYTEWNEAGNITFANTYVMGVPEVKKNRGESVVSKSCKPILYNDVVCRSVADLTLEVARLVRPIQETTDSVAILLETQLELNRIWNFVSIQRPEMFFLDFTSYQQHRSSYTSVSVEPIQGAKIFVFSTISAFETKRPQSFRLMYYTDGSIEFLSDMLSIEVYGTPIIDFE